MTQRLDTTHLDDVPTPVPFVARLGYGAGVVAAVCGIAELAGWMPVDMPVGPWPTFLIAAGLLSGAFAIDVTVGVLRLARADRARRQQPQATPYLSDVQLALAERILEEAHGNRAPRPPVRATPGVARHAPRAAVAQPGTPADAPAAPPTPARNTLDEGPLFVDITFDNLRDLPSLLLNSIKANLERVPPLRDEQIAERTIPDAYHVRADGPRYDVRLLAASGI